MSLTISPTDSDIFRTLRTFLLDVLPHGDAVFSASIAGDQMTVTAISDGTINIGDTVLGENVQTGTTVAEFGTGTGGTGVYTITPSQDPVPATTMSTGLEVIQSQVNRVPEPRTADFVLMTLQTQLRLTTNVDGYVDTVFNGSIAGTVMTVDTLQRGAIRIGANVWGPGVAENTTVRAVGALNLYSVFPAQNVGPVTMAAGSKSIVQSSQVSIQLDVHGPDSSNTTSIISTVFRDGYAVEAFQVLSDLITPLYADDPRQMPFNNAEQQIENRWVVEVNMQINYTVNVPQQFYDSATITLVEVETTFPVQ